MTSKDIAIIGIAGRFPFAKNMEEFYLHLRNGKDCVSSLSEQRIRSTTLPDDVEYDEGGYMEGIELFDHEFFKISQGEANHMDPRQRLLLEVVYETMENAGYNTDHFNNSDTALYVADNYLNYYLHAEEIDATLMMGNLSAATAGRIARFFNLRGSAEMVDTACSSSLAVLNHACNELILGNADYALACGANIYVFPGVKVAERSGLEIRSPDSRAKAFAAGANGTVEGEAVVCVLLKPLEKAIADKDVIHAVIKAVASNQDGALSSSLTAPDSKAQAQVITKAWKKANVDPNTITYIEAHGTGTKLGDPIEIDGLNMAFREFTDKQHFCAISSVKTNIGHTDVVAGLAGVAKAVLSLRKKELFPSLHFDAPNPYIDFNNSAVYVNTTLQPWLRGNAPRRAGVSSYGLIGTNYHAVLEEAPEPAATTIVTERASYLFNLSAASVTSLCDTAAELYKYLSAQPLMLQDISYTLNAGRKQHRYRCSFIAGNKEQLLQALQDIANGHTLPVTVNTMNMICCFSAGAIVSAAALDAYSEQYPEFGAARAACDQIAPGMAEDAAYRQFVFQYAFYRQLTAKGVISLQLLGDGIGKLVITVLKQEITLQEGIRRVLQQEWTPVLPEELFARLRKYIEKEQVSSNYVFAGMEPGGDITGALKEIFALQGNGLVITPAEHGTDGLLDFIQQLHLAGVAINWDHFFRDMPVKRVALPAYRFQPKRCWIKEMPALQAEKSFYGMQWVPQPLPAAKREKATGPLLVIMDEKGLGEILVKKLQAAGHTCICIRYGAAFCKIDNTSFEINPANREHFTALRTAVRDSFPAIGGVICLANYRTPAPVTAENADTLLETGLYAQLLLMQAFWYELDDKQVDILTVSANAHAVLPEEKVRMPLSVMSEVFIKGIGLEFTRLHVKGIDLDAEGTDPEMAAGCIMQEWEADTLPRFAAIRKGSRWAPNLSALTAAETAVVKPVDIRPGGVYLVTGGAGGIGLEVCRSLAARNKVQLIIFGRKQLPPPAEWAAYNGELSATIKELSALQASGSTVWYHALDVADAQQVEAAFAAVKTRYQQLDGIFHAAGVFEKGFPLPDWTPQQFGKALAPKVKGSLLLAEHSRSLHPAFMVLFSSINAIAIPACNTDYAAANAFQDALAGSNFYNGTRVISINWPGWADTGMLFRSGHVGKTGYLKNISTQEGLEMLYRIMSTSREQVTVLPFNGKAAAIILEDNPFFLAGAKQEKPESIPAPAAPQSPVATGDTAATVLKIWYEVLQSDNISENDDFFDLGGHSLNGMQVINKLNKIYGTELDFEVLLDYATVSTLAAYIDDWTAQHNKPAVEEKDIMPAPLQDAYDLSYAQKKLWLFDQVEKDKQPYIMPEAYFIGMALNADAMRRAVETVVKRHESLRTVFIVKDGVPKQKVRSFEDSGFTCLYMDLSHYTDADERVKLQTSAHAQLPFDLAKGPLIRVTLIKRSEEAYVILIAVHHIIADAWSMDVIIDEVLQCYYAYGQQMPDPLTPLRIQYRDYVAWQQQQRSSGKWEAHRSFWLETLGGTLPVLQLPLDMERGSLQTFRGADISLQIDTAVLSSLKQLCQEQDTTLYVVLLSAYVALLHRYSGQYDILLASPVAGRKHEDLASQVGFYINTLLVRTKLEDNMSFAALVQQTRQYMIRALLHDEYPFDLLVEDLQVERVTNRSLLIDSGFSWISSHTGAAVQPLYNIHRLEDEVVAAKYDLWMYGTEVADGILFKLEYNCDLFRASSMQLFVERWVSLIMQVIKQPGILLNDIIMDSMLLHDEAETMPYAGDSFNFEYPLGNS